jgi:hypothetical protein
VKMWRRLLTVALTLAWLFMVAAMHDVAAKPPGLEVTIQPGPPYIARVAQPLTIVISVRNIGLTEHGVTAPAISNPDITATLELPAQLVRVEAIGRANYASPIVMSTAQRTIIEWKAIPDREKIPEQKTVDMSLRLTLLSAPPNGEFNVAITAQSVDGYADQKVFKFVAQTLATATLTRTATLRPTFTATVSPTPTALPTATPTPSATALPIATPTSSPTLSPTSLPTLTPQPTAAPTTIPLPTSTPTPTLAPGQTRAEMNDVTWLWVVVAGVVVALLSSMIGLRRRA